MEIPINIPEKKIREIAVEESMACDEQLHVRINRVEERQIDTDRIIMGLQQEIRKLKNQLLFIQDKKEGERDGKNKRGNRLGNNK